MGQIEEEVWMGRSLAYFDPISGEGRQINTHSIHGRTNPSERTIHWHVPFGAVAPGFIILPDARSLPLGGPLYNFIVTADPGVPLVQWFNFNSTVVVSYVPPVAVKWYVIDNSTEDGLWAWKASPYAFVATSDLADIANFGATAGGLGAIDKYSVLADTWSVEADSGENWTTCGVSWTAGRSLIRKGGSVWSHTAGVTSFQSNGGFGNVDKCSFARMFSPLIGTRHYGFGNFDFGSHASDFYEFVGNTFTVIPDNFQNAGWNEGQSAGVKTNPLVPQDHIINILATVDFANALHPTFLYNVASAVYFVIQPTSGASHYARAPLVTLATKVHMLGGAGSTTNSFNVNSRWHHAYVSNGLAGWLTRPWIPVPLRGHGCQYLPNPGGEKKCFFSMGKDHSFFPSNNTLGFRYDDNSESFVAAGGSAWVSRQEQGTSWAHLD